MEKSLQIVWYGRCCFSIVLDNTKILFDPYDRFCNVDMGLVDAEILLSSSSWHDHGHIGASPGSFVFTYPGVYQHKNILITGINTEEDRGSANVVFNVKSGGFSVTNFADLGSEKIEEFAKSLTDQQSDILQKTNIAFIRSGREKLMNYFNAEYIFPEHYFPRQFIESNIPSELKHDYEKQNIEIDKMLTILNCPSVDINDYKYNAVLEQGNQTKVIRLLSIHPQVKYTPTPEVKRYW